MCDARQRIARLAPASPETPRPSWDTDAPMRHRPKQRKAPQPSQYSRLSPVASRLPFLRCDRQGGKGTTIPVKAV